MEKSKIVLQADLSRNEEIGNKFSTGKIVRFFLIIFLFSSMGFLSSCAVAVRNPQPQRQGFFFKRSTQGESGYQSTRHDNGRGHKYGHYKGKKGKGKR